MSIRSTNHRIKRIILTGISALALSATLSLGEAQADPSELRQVKVRFDELDLSKPAGAEALYRRLQSAAGKVCDSKSVVYKNRRDHACYQTALTNAVVQVNSPLLSQIHGMQMERLAVQK
jgi:UrcA family protein